MNKDFRSHLLSYPYEHTEWVKVPFWVVTPFLDLQLRFVIVSLDLDHTLHTLKTEHLQCIYCLKPRFGLNALYEAKLYLQNGLAKCKNAAKPIPFQLF